jgi:hypothetical protein
LLRDLSCILAGILCTGSQNISNLHFQPSATIPELYFTNQPGQFLQQPVRTAYQKNKHLELWTMPHTTLGTWERFICLFLAITSKKTILPDP